MKIYNYKHDDILKGVEQTLERETRKRIFTIRVLNEGNDNENSMEVLVVFKDKSVLITRVTVLTVEGNMALRLKGDFI